jgi:indole-3-glycerol phosphate synthase
MWKCEEDVSRKVSRIKRFQKKGSLALEDLEKKIGHLPPPRDFLKAISQNGPVALIAEIKHASPSAGVIKEEVNLQRTITAYESGGASAISVLTEAHFFKGDLSHLGEVRGATTLPVLQKDFILDPFQIHEGRVEGADAVLLIASLLEKEELRDLADLARKLECFLWWRSITKTILKGMALDLPLIGINNRNLKTLEWT